MSSFTGSDGAKAERRPESLGSPLATEREGWQMNIQDAAKELDGCEYGKEGSPELFARMKAAGLVAVFGASDDLMEFRGAIDDEVGAYQGTTAHIGPDGLAGARCENEHCPYDAEAKNKAAKIKAKWDSGGFSWTYETKIPHASFVVKEDGENYCAGIVFALKDARPSP